MKQNGSESNKWEKKERSRIMKQKVKQCNLRADEEDGARVLEHYKGNQKVFGRM